MKNTRVAKRYAQAWMAVAEDLKLVDQTAHDLETIDALLKASRELRLLVASPIVSVKKKAEIFDALFASRVGSSTHSFLNLIVSKKRESVLPEIIEQFNVLRDEKLGIVTVEVKSAVEFTPPQEQSLQSQLEQYTKRKVRVRFSLDSHIRGGLMVKIGDTVLDASIRRQLERLRERFVAGDALSN